MEQHRHAAPLRHEAVLVWGPSLARQLSSALPRFVPLKQDISTVLWSQERSPVFSSSQVNTVFGRKGTHALWDRGELSYGERSTHPWSLTGPFSCRWGLQILTVWLVQKHCPGCREWSWLWLFVEDALEGTAAVGQGKSPSFWLKSDSRNSLYKGWLRWQKHSAGKPFCAGVSLKHGLHERLLFSKGS